MPVNTFFASDCILFLFPSYIPSQLFWQSGCTLNSVSSLKFRTFMKIHSKATQISFLTLSYDLFSLLYHTVLSRTTHDVKRVWDGKKTRWEAIFYTSYMFIQFLWRELCCYSFSILHYFQPRCWIGCKSIRWFSYVAWLTLMISGKCSETAVSFKHTGRNKVSIKKRDLGFNTDNKVRYFSNKQLMYSNTQYTPLGILSNTLK